MLFPLKLSEYIVITNDKKTLNLKCFPSAKLAIFINIFIGRVKYGSLDQLNSMTSQRSKK